MKTNLFYALTTAAILLMIPITNFGQPIDLGAAANFVLFTQDGAVSDNPSNHSHLTGNLGYETSGAFSGFGNVDGVMHPGVDPATSAAGVALLTAIAQINTTTSTGVLAGSLGNGDTLTPGVYTIGADATLTTNLVLDALGDSDAEFIFKIGGTFSATTNSKIILINGAQACHIFWNVVGTVSFATGVNLKGNFISAAAISMTPGDTLEGRALVTVGAINVDGVLAYMPLGCGVPVLTGPAAPTLGATECFALFSSSGGLSNSGATYVTGDVGSNNMAPTGFITQNVTGTIHTSDVSTAAAASDMPAIYSYLDLMTEDIELLYPAQFGNNLVLTPHTYLLDEGTVFTDTLYLNAQGNSDAVFIIQVNGALATSPNAHVKLINGADAKNVYWVVDGATSILSYSRFKGTVVSSSGAMDLDEGVRLDGRLLTSSGAIITTAVVAVVPPSCFTTGISSVNGETESFTIYPNPFNSSLTIVINDASQLVITEARIYNELGEVVLCKLITCPTTTIESINLAPGIYYYSLTEDHNIIQSGKLISAY